MKNTIYTSEQIEKIQLNMIALLYYIRMYDKQNSPMCFRFCETIVKNITICRNNNYNDIDELTKLIKNDWKCAMEPHTGLNSYFILNDTFDIQKAINTTIQEQISFIDNLIEGTQYE